LSTSELFVSAPRLSFWALQHFRIRKPYFSSSLLRRRLRNMPSSSKVSPSGFGYPLGDLCLPILGSLFQLPTLMGFALQSFSLLLEPINPFRIDLPALALSYKTSRLRTGASAAYCSLQKPCSSLLPRMFSSGRSLLLSWAFGSLGLSLNQDLGRKFLCPFIQPLSPLKY
jgi:hypothetical protein